MKVEIIEAFINGIIWWRIYYNGKLTHTCKLRSQAVEIAIANYGHKLVFPS